MPIRGLTAADFTVLEDARPAEERPHDDLASHLDPLAGLNAGEYLLSSVSTTGQYSSQRDVRIAIK